MAQAKVKAALKNVPIPEKIQKINVVVGKLTANTNFPAVQSKLAAVTSGVSTLQASYGAALSARQTAKQKTDVQDSDETALDGLIAGLVTDVNQEGGGDAAKLLTSGFELAKDPSAAAVPGPATDFSLTRGDNPGEIDGHCHAVADARSYESETFVGALPSGPFVPGKSFFASKFAWTGFNSGDKVWIRIRAVGTAGEGPWSDPMALIAP